MKKLLFAAIAVLGFTQVNAQEVKFGAKAGVNLANVNGDIEDNSMKVGFHVGGVAEIMFNDKFALQPEVLFSDQGTKLDFGGVDVNYNLSYINVPIMGKYYVADGLSLEAGPQVGFLISSKAKADGDSVDIEDLNGVDFGLNFGLGYKLDMGVFFNGRYNLGLSNIESEGDESIKNGVIQFSVGYMF